MNNCQCPEATKEQKEKIEKTEQPVLDARAIYPGASLADLYDDIRMIEGARGRPYCRGEILWRGFKETDEAFSEARLMWLYQEKTDHHGWR